MRHYELIELSQFLKVSKKLIDQIRIDLYDSNGEFLSDPTVFQLGIFDEMLEELKENIYTYKYFARKYQEPHQPIIEIVEQAMIQFEEYLFEIFMSKF